MHFIYTYIETSHEGFWKSVIQVLGAFLSGFFPCLPVVFIIRFLHPDLHVPLLSPFPLSRPSTISSSTTHPSLTERFHFSPSPSPSLLGCLLVRIASSDFDKFGWCWISRARVVRCPRVEIHHPCLVRHHAVCFGC